MELILKNPKTTFDVEAVDGELSLSGATCSVDIEKSEITEFNAGIKKNDDHAGHVYYQEKDGRVACNVSDVSGGDYVSMHAFAYACVDAIRDQIFPTK